MKMRWNIILSVLLAFSLVSFGQKKKNTFSSISLYQIEFSTVTIHIDKKTKDTLSIEGTLKEVTIIDGIPCKGNLTLTKGGKLKKYTLAGALHFNGNIFPPGTSIELIDLDCRSDINSLKYYFAIREARIRIFNLCHFPSAQIIEDVSCNGQEGVFFKTDWSLLACILEEADTIKGNLMPENTFVRFNHDGCMICF